MITAKQHQDEIKRRNRSRNPNNNIHVRLNTEIKKMSRHYVGVSNIAAMDEAIDWCKARIQVARLNRRYGFCWIEKQLASKDLITEQQFMIELTNRLIAWRVIESQS